MTLALAGTMDRELSKQRDWHWMRHVATIPLRQKLALDLRGAQGDVPHDQIRPSVADDAGARNSGGMIVPGVPLKPHIQRVSAAIEMAALVLRREWSRRRYFRHVGGLRASSLSAGTARPGLAAHASKRAQSFAGIVTTRRSSTSISAAASALRRTKSLTLVCACDEAASRSARSSLLNRTLRTEDDMVQTSMCMTIAYAGCNINDLDRVQPFRHTDRPPSHPTPSWSRCSAPFRFMASADPTSDAPGGLVARIEHSDIRNDCAAWTYRPGFRYVRSRLRTFFWEDHR